MNAFVLYLGLTTIASGMVPDLTGTYESGIIGQANTRFIVEVQHSEQYLGLYTAVWREPSTGRICYCGELRLRDGELVEHYLPATPCSDYGWVFNREGVAQVVRDGSNWWMLKTRP